MRQIVSEKLEDYLEVIFSFEGEKRPARVKDIAEALSVHKSTVTSALRSLSEKGLVNYMPYETANLTTSGRRIAKEVRQHHNTIRRFLTEVLLIDEDTADENACRMEHVIDKKVLERLACFARFVKTCPRAGRDWLLRFSEFIVNGEKIYKDKAKARQFIEDFEKKVVK